MDELHKIPQVQIWRGALCRDLPYLSDVPRRDICNSINDTRSTLKSVNNGEIITIKIKGAEIMKRDIKWGPITDKEMDDTRRYLLVADQGGVYIRIWPHANRQPDHLHSTRHLW